MVAFCLGPIIILILCANLMNVSRVLLHNCRIAGFRCETSNVDSFVRWLKVQVNRGAKVFAYLAIIDDDNRTLRAPVSLRRACIELVSTQALAMTAPYTRPSPS